MRCLLLVAAGLGFVLVHPARVLFASLDSCVYTGGTVNGRATVVDARNLLRSDGESEYVHGAQSARVYAQAALNIFPFASEARGRRAGGIGRGRQTTVAVAAQRHLLVDLNQPVPNGGGIPRGLVTSFAGPHTYWRVEDSKGTEKRLIHGVMDIPVGTTTDSDLTSLFIASDDGKTSYLLQMGPWSWDTCENYGPVETKGSTKVRITRTSATTFTTIAPPGTVGVLHDVQNLLKPVPVGLYYMSFEIRYTVDATP